MKGEWGVFNGYRTLILQDEESLGDWLYNDVNVLDATEQYTLKNG